LTQSVCLLHEISPKIRDSTYPIYAKDILSEMIVVEQYIFVKLFIIFFTLLLIDCP